MQIYWKLSVAKVHSQTHEFKAAVLQRVLGTKFSHPFLSNVYCRWVFTINKQTLKWRVLLIPVEKEQDKSSKYSWVCQ